MGVVASGLRILGRLLGRHGPVRSFDEEVQAGGGVAGRVDGGTHTVDTRKIVGSVGRAHALRSDFFYRGLRPITTRFRRVGAAMQEGKELPPLELYRVRRAGEHKGAAPPSEYYVVDGHHRVAMARKLGQDFLDAHIVDYRVGHTASGEGAGPVPEGEASGGEAGGGAERLEPPRL